MTPTAAYRRLNKGIWLGRLPVALVRLVPNATIPECEGITIHNDLVLRPVIHLNASSKHWGKTLVHEMVHVAEPYLNHGLFFDALVDKYWRMAKQILKQSDPL